MDYFWIGFYGAMGVTAAWLAITVLCVVLSGAIILGIATVEAWRR